MRVDKKQINKKEEERKKEKRDTGNICKGTPKMEIKNKWGTKSSTTSVLHRVLRYLHSERKKDIKKNETKTQMCKVSTKNLNIAKVNKHFHKSLIRV